MATSPKKHKHVVLREKLQSKFSKRKPNSKIPSARDLAATYDVSIMTIRQSLAALQADGLLYTIPIGVRGRCRICAHHIRPGACIGTVHHIEGYQDRIV